MFGEKTANEERNRRIGHITINHTFLLCSPVHFNHSCEYRIAFSVRVSVVFGLLPRSRGLVHRNEEHDAGTRKQTNHKCVMLLHLIGQLVFSREYEKPGLPDSDELTLLVEPMFSILIDVWWKARPPPSGHGSPWLYMSE